MTKNKAPIRADIDITDDELHTSDEWDQITERNLREIYEMDDPYWKGIWITHSDYNHQLEELAKAKKNDS